MLNTFTAALNTRSMYQRFVTLCKPAPYTNSLTYLLTYLSDIGVMCYYCEKTQQFTTPFKDDIRKPAVQRHDVTVLRSNIILL